MKKIGIFLGFEPHGGGTFQYNQSILDAVASLPPERFSVVVGYTSEVWRDCLPRRDNLKGVHVPQSFWGRGIGLAWLVLRLPMGMWRKISPLIHPMAKAMLKEKCDLWIFPSQDARSFQIPVPALVTILDLAHRYCRSRPFPEVFSRWELLNREPTFTNICRWAKEVLVVSEFDKRQVMDNYHLPGERIHVLPMVPPQYIHSREVPEDFENRYRLPSRYLFYPAQFWEHKNHKNLVRAVAALKPEMPDLKLVLAGSKKNAWEAVVDLISELHLNDDVILLGYVPDAYMPELYRRARAMVFPTFWGPCHIPPLEALEVGCPMALSEIASMPDRVGDAALVFNPDSVEEIAGCIRRLWTDDRLRADLAEKGKLMAARWGQEQFNAKLREIVVKLTEGAHDEL